jgi:hypothetical protein
MTKPSLAGDATVAAYLEADPEFFLRHPELTARLRLPPRPRGHPVPGRTSDGPAARPGGR